MAENIFEIKVTAHNTTVKKTLPEWASDIIQSVKKSGDEEIEGVKTFQTAPFVPETPTEDGQMVSKKYADTHVPLHSSRHATGGDDEITPESIGAVRSVNGKGLSDANFTQTEKDKLEDIEANAQVNVIESISFNGSDLTPDANKRVTIPMVVCTQAEYNAMTSHPSTTIYFIKG